MHVLVFELQVDCCYIDIRIARYLLQSARIHSLPHAVYGKAVPEGMRVGVLTY
jgi:hypothetical protein